MVRGLRTFFIGVAALAFTLAGWLAICAAPVSAQTPSAPAGRYVVVLDAAHGGSDSGGTLTGAAGSGTGTGASGQEELEKDYTLAFSVRLRSLLAARGIAVVTTRESDATLDAGQRAQIANHVHAQACLALHAAMSGSGVHLFISSQQPAARSARLHSNSENPSSATRLTPWKTAQTAALVRSVALAGTLNSALLHAGLPVTLGRTELTTIDSMTCPAVAVEIAPEAAERSSDAGPGHAAEAIDDPGYEAQIAEALAAGLLEWGATTPSASSAEGQKP
jgi:N-acetylmuramoyl-L-alanine amidase